MPEMTQQTRRDDAVFRERLLGADLRDIAKRHDLSPEGVRIVVAREGRRQVDEIHLALVASHATGELPAIAIPDHGGEDFDLAMEWVRWIVDQLSRVGMRVKVHYRPVFNGIVVALEDRDPPLNSKLTKESA
jgi:hypothetical protein